jgi:hypothetical protein
MPLFQKSVVNKYLANLDSVAVAKAYEQFQQFYGDAERIENIRLLKEENYQEGFYAKYLLMFLAIQSIQIKTIILPPNSKTKPILKKLMVQFCLMEKLLVLSN